MQKGVIDIELEPEDIELLTRVGRETGKSVSQLTLEAIRATYKSDFDSDRDSAIALIQAIHKIQQQTREVLAAVHKQNHEIEKFSNSPTNRSKQDAQQFYPPPLSIYT